MVRISTLKNKQMMLFSNFIFLFNLYSRQQITGSSVRIFRIFLHFVLFVVAWSCCWIIKIPFTNQKSFIETWHKTCSYNLLNNLNKQHLIFLWCVLYSTFFDKRLSYKKFHHTTVIGQMFVVSMDDCLRNIRFGYKRTKNSETDFFFPLSLQGIYNFEAKSSYRW